MVIGRLFFKTIHKKQNSLLSKLQNPVEIEAQRFWPIRGKILNVEKHGQKILANEEIRSLFTAMETGFAQNLMLQKRYQN